MKSSAMFLSAALLAFVAQAVESDSFKVDFGIWNDSSPVCEGWNAFGWSSGQNAYGPRTNVYACANSRIADGNVTVAVAAGSGPEDSSQAVCARDRTAFADADVFALSSVYRDWINSSSGVGLWVSLMGLHPRTIYRFKAYAYDNSNTSMVTMRQWANGTDSTTTASIAYVAGTVFSADTSEDIYAAEIELVSDAEGHAVVHLTATPKGSLISGFELMRGREWDPFEVLVDFGSNATSALQDGAKIFYASENADPRSWTYDGLSPKGSSGTVTVGISFAVDVASGKKIITRDRKDNGFTADDFPYYNLYRDLEIAQATAMWIDVSGLTPGARYELTACPYDNSVSRTYNLADWTTGEEKCKKTVTTQKGYAFTAETPRDIFAMTLSATADEEGKIRLKLSSGGETGIGWLEVKYRKPGLAISLR